jgi:hypothetical protein
VMGKKEKNALLFTTYKFLSLSLSRSLFEYFECFFIRGNTVNHRALSISTLHCDI